MNIKKLIKWLTKPFVVIFAIIAIFFVNLARKTIVKLKIKPMYKHLNNLKITQSNMYRLMFNPYRISNGIRPSVPHTKTNPAEDLQRCHEIISKQREEREKKLHASLYPEA